MTNLFLQIVEYFTPIFPNIFRFFLLLNNTIVTTEDIPQCPVSVVQLGALKGPAPGPQEAPEALFAIGVSFVQALAEAYCVQFLYLINAPGLKGRALGRVTANVLTRMLLSGQLQDVLLLLEVDGGG